MFLLFAIFFLLTSCSSIEYTSQDTIPVFVGTTPNHNKSKTISGTKQFYLWGLLPEKHQVFLDEEFDRLKVDSIAEVQIEEYQTVGNFLKTIISLGMYVPINYKLTGKSSELNRISR